MGITYANRFLSNHGTVNTIPDLILGNHPGSMQKGLYQTVSPVTGVYAGVRASSVLLAHLSLDEFVEIIETKYVAEVDY